MKEKQVINDALVGLFNQVLKLEEKAIATGKFSNITVNDMHIIETVGLDKKNMSSIAKGLGITVGSLTISMNSLVTKGYVERERSEEDRRVVYIKLTELGKKAYTQHKNYHDKMTDAVIKAVTKDELTVLVKTLSKLSEFFHESDEKPSKKTK